jgi:hypothetical protein
MDVVFIPCLDIKGKLVVVSLIMLQIFASVGPLIELARLVFSLNLRLKSFCSLGVGCAKWDMHPHTQRA